MIMNAVGIIRTILTSVVGTRIAREMTNKLKSSNIRPSFDNVYVAIDPIKLRNTATKSTDETKEKQPINKPAKRYPAPK
jgi:hypothetical protein